MEEVLAYCKNSANPVGRLVLYVCGYSDAERFRLSDATCTALQLANFWQDVSSDYQKRGRIYIPQDAMQRFGVTEATIASAQATPEFRALIRSQVDYARTLFEAGLPVIGMVNNDLALDLDLFSRGGLEVLRAIEQRDYDVLSARPAISRPRKIALALRAVSGKFLPGLRLKSKAA
jgi:squalene synthase HpnC